MFKPTVYNITIFLSIVWMGCTNDPTPMPTEKLMEEVVDSNPAYQNIYHMPALSQPDSNQQRVRALLWLKRMNCNISQLQKLEELRQIVVDKQQQLQIAEEIRTKKIYESYTPIYNQLWDSIRQGQDLDSETVQESLTNLQQLQEQESQNPTLNPRIEMIKSIIEAEETFLRSLSPEQESTIVDALYFLRHKLDPVGNPKDFSLLIGNTFEPGQYAILLKGTSELAQQSGNIGGLWSDEPELTGRVLHEAQREVVLYLALLEPGLEEAIRAAMALQNQSTAP